MAQRDGMVAGWRLFSAWAATDLPIRPRRAILGTGVVVSIAASAGAEAAFDAVRLFGRTEGGAWAALTLAAFFAGSGLGSLVAALVLVVVRRRLLRERRRGAQTPSTEVTTRLRRFRGSGVPPGGEAEIRAAWLAGREPDVSLPQRLSAAQSARTARATLPALILSSLAALPFWVAGSGFALTIVLAEPDLDVTVLIAPVYLLLFGGQALPYLHALGRTTAPLETAPAVPDHLLPDGRKKPVPRKPLGTDHPDDYS